MAEIILSLRILTGSDAGRVLLVGHRFSLPRPLQKNGASGRPRDFRDVQECREALLPVEHCDHWSVGDFTKRWAVWIVSLMVFRAKSKKSKVFDVSGSIFQDRNESTGNPCMRLSNS
jgi:hypothetical protein